MSHSGIGHRIMAHLVHKPVSEETVHELPEVLKKFQLHGKVAIVTGGARSLGLNMAEALCQAGLKAIAIIDIQEELGQTAAKELHEKSGIPANFYKVDVRDAQSVDETVKSVVETFGSVDILINAAGIADSCIKAEDYDAEAFRRSIDINLTGSFLCAQAVGRAMIRAGKGGSIIFIASMSGSVVNFPQEQCAYNASKAGVIQLCKSLAAEWAKHKIRCNSISPGYMDTALNRQPGLEEKKKIWLSLTPMQRLGLEDELNGLTVYLASDASTYMTGSDILIDGGYSVL